MSASRADDRTKRTIKWCPLCFKTGNPFTDRNILDELHGNLGISGKRILEFSGFLLVDECVWVGKGWGWGGAPIR